MTKELMIYLRKYFQESSKIALALIEDKRSFLKPDQSLVTDADKKISDLAFEMLSFMIRPEFIITEESLDNLNNLRKTGQKVKDELLVIIDPIDGTRNYAHKLPIYGISLGVLKDRKPWVGMIYFPEMDELYYSDHENAYFERNAFRGNPEIIKIKKQESHMDYNSIVFANDNFLRVANWNFDFCNLIVPSCAVSNLCWPLTGRGNAAVFGANIWDMAGAWPIMQKAGFEMRNIQTGKVMEYFNFDDFKDSWRIKDHHVMSLEEDFKAIQKAISFK